MFRRLSAHAHELGLELSVWNPEGLRVGEFEPNCEFCRTVSEVGGCCMERVREIAAQASENGKPVATCLSSGSAVVAVPIRKRRRIVGTVTTCWPSRMWLDDEYVARRCDELHLDRQIVSAMVRKACCRDQKECDEFLPWLEWVVENEQALHVANNELATLSTNLSSTYEELSLLYSISRSMRVTQSPEAFLLAVCEEVHEVMNLSAAAAVLYAHPPAVHEDTVVIAGDLGLTKEQVMLLAATQITPMLAKNNRSVVANQFKWAAHPDLGKEVRNLVAVPLMAEHSMGMLLAFNKESADFNSVDIKLMNSIGNQSTVFLTNNMLYADLQDLLMGVLHALTATIDAKDPYTCGHSNRVAIISKRLAESMGLPAQRVQQIYLAGLMHDIGKIGVPESVLCKPGRLTAEEYEAIKKHPGLGVKILGGIRQLDHVIAGMLCHHERLDGGGYPQGLCGDEVPLDARIIGLADCFDAMSSDRTYRKALPLEAVVGEVRKCAGTQFDPKVVEHLLSWDLDALLKEMCQPAKTVFPVSIAQEDAV
jgi:HD-GYP domain-containing protein (c-di-GMP phosphodiesterase class II)